jgi:hypothetical protein
MHLRTAKKFDNRYLPPVARARSALLQQTVPVILAAVSSPKLAVIIIAESNSNDVLSAISALAPALTSMEASLLLIDRGCNSNVALAPSLFGNLRYILDPQGNLKSLLVGALKYSQGDFLIFIRNPGKAVVQCLLQVAAEIHDSNAIYFNARSALLAREICAEPRLTMSWRSTKFKNDLEFAGKREFFEKIRDLSPPIDRVTGLEGVDLAIRFMRDGNELCVWDNCELEQKSSPRVEATH